jgi:2-polyprenyl-6-methoxyphenol hydroxylase-like FAD-dependent oxidoreductase
MFLRMATPEHPYVIAFFPIENQRWLLSYIGVNKQYPPSREDQFTSALANLASPAVNEMVRHMEPISPVYPSRATRNRWRHYERWQKPLGRFIAIADAACSYNPRFGQGMSAAAVSVKILNDCLVKYGVSDRLSDRLFSARARFQRTPWLFAAADDLRSPDTLGNLTAVLRLFNWYRPMVARCSSQRIGKRLNEVTQFVRLLSSLFAPQIVSRLVVAAIRRQTKQVNQQASSRETSLMQLGTQY